MKNVFYLVIIKLSLFNTSFPHNISWYEAYKASFTTIKDNSISLCEEFRK